MIPMSSKKIKTENCTFCLKNQFQKLIAFSSQFVVCCSLLFFWGSSVLCAQEVIISDDPKSNTTLLDSIELTASGLPLLKPFQSDSMLSPHYEHLWIFGDGNFINGTKDSIIRHRYEITKPGVDTFNTQTFLSGLYSGGGDPPPKIIDGDIPVENLNYLNGKPFKRTEGVQGGWIRLQKNHLQLVPADTTVWILSFKNILQQTAPISGQLFLFFDSSIESVNYNPLASNSKTRSVVSTYENAPKGNFRFDTTLFLFDGVVSNTYMLDTISAATLGKNYQRALVWQFNELAPGEERHLFIQFKDDPQLLQKVFEGTDGQVRFMSVITTNQSNLDYQRPESFTPNLIETYGIQEFIDNLEIPKEQQSALDLPPAATGFNEFKFTLGRNILDATEVVSPIAPIHAPNQLRVDACVCPDNSGGAQKLLCTIDIVNNGNESTEDLFISMHIPTELDINSIPDTLLMYDENTRNPASPTKVILEKNPFQRIVKWSLLNYPLQAAQDKGVGHPSTTGQITFSILSRPGLALEAIPALQACISFNANETDKLCTISAKARPLITSKGDEILACNECVVPMTSKPIPVLFWVLLAVIVGFIPIIHLGRKRLLNKTQEMVASSQ